jgi:hypothetical protein
MARNQESSMQNSSNLGHSVSGEWSGKELVEDGKQSWHTEKSHFKQYGPLQKPPQKGMDQRQHLQFIAP